MPITRLLTDSDFTLEQRQVLELAFNATLRKLSLTHLLQFGRAGVL